MVQLNNKHCEYSVLAIPPPLPLLDEAVLPEKRELIITVDEDWLYIPAPYVAAVL